MSIDADAEVALLVKEHLRRIGERIREFRTLQGMTLPELEEVCGVPFTQISRIENGQRNSSVRILVEIADGLGVQLHELFVPPEMSQVRAKKRAAPAKKKTAKRSKKSAKKTG